MNIKSQALITLGENRDIFIYMLPKDIRPGIYLKDKVDLVICSVKTYENNKNIIDESLNDTGTVFTY